MNLKLRSIESILSPPSVHMVGDGFRVHNFFPSDPRIGMTGMSPFFLMDYNSKWEVSPSEKQRGVGVHPHKGFETVTIAYRGKVAHHDSAGNSGVIEEGDVQWMTAGNGVLHKEYHEKEFSRKGGIFQMVQLWVNLPAKYKTTPPKYQAISNRDMGNCLLDDGKSFIEVIAGDFKGTKGPASTFSPVNLFNARLIDGAKILIPFDKMFNTGILVVEGKIIVNDTSPVIENHFVLFGHDNKNIMIEALEKSTILVLSGEPINEPIAAGGPFVLNTEAELRQAYRDFASGKFGHLED